MEVIKVKGLLSKCNTGYEKRSWKSNRRQASPKRNGEEEEWQ